MALHFIFSILFKVIDVYMLLLGVFALMSWFPGAYQSALGYWVGYFVNPLLRPFRKLNLRFGMLDLTVLGAFVALNFSRHILMQIYAMMFTLW